MAIEQTLVMIKPHAVKEGLISLVTGTIFFEIGKQPLTDYSLVLTPEIIKQFYKGPIEKYSQEIPDFEERLLKAMKGEAAVYVYEADNAIERIRTLIGPTDPEQSHKYNLNTIRRLSRDSLAKASEEKRMVNNIVHASDSKESAEYEIGIFFEKKEGFYISRTIKPEETPAPAKPYTVKKKRNKFSQ